MTLPELREAATTLTVAKPVEDAEEMEEFVEPEIEQLIEGYFDESLEPAELESLAAWIRADAGIAKQFARAALLHDRLFNEVAIQAEEAIAEKVAAFPRRNWLTAAAVVLALGLGLWFLVGPAGDDDAFVTISRVEDDMGLSVGERRGEGVVRFGSGVIRMLFDSGVGNGETVDGAVGGENAGGRGEGHAPLDPGSG